MTDDRYVVIGLAHVRAAWFTEVARWSTAGAIPVEFVKCISAEQLRARAAGGRPFSAALLDGGLPAVDRDLIAGLTDADVPSLVVAPERSRDWTTLGAAGTLAPTFGSADLLDALAAHCRRIPSVADDATPRRAPARPSSAWRGRLVAVTGQPGSGRSTVAAALAQGLARDPRYAGDVVLADLAHRAHQAVLHDARDVVPGIQEVVESHRTGRPTTTQLRSLTFDVPARGYRLLLGMRRPRDWVTIRAQAFGAALDALCRSSRVVVADVDGDLQGEAETGSFDIEDRNLMARATLAAADVVVAVATPSLTGVHALVTILHELRGHGVDGARTVAVVNRAPKAPRARAELTRTVANLAGSADRPDPPVGPAYVPERRGVDALHRDLAPFPRVIADPVANLVREVLDRVPPSSPAYGHEEPVAVVPGSLGHWGGDQEATS